MIGGFRCAGLATRLGIEKRWPGVENLLVLRLEPAPVMADGLTAEISDMHGVDRIVEATPRAIIVVALPCVLTIFERQVECGLEMRLADKCSFVTPFVFQILCEAGRVFW